MAGIDRLGNYDKISLFVAIKGGELDRSTYISHYCIPCFLGHPKDCISANIISCSTCGNKNIKITDENCSNRKCGRDVISEEKWCSLEIKEYFEHHDIKK